MTRITRFAFAADGEPPRWGLRVVSFGAVGAGRALGIFNRSSPAPAGDGHRPKARQERL